jgi:hypothetical protein
VQDVLAERYVWAVGLANITDEEFVGNASLDHRERVKLAMTLLMTVPFLWREDVLAITKGLPVPAHVVSREVLPHPMMWFTFETGHESEGDSLVPDATLDGIALIDAGAGFNVYHFGSGHDGRGPLAVSAGVIRYGERFPDDFPGNTLPAAERILGMLSFLNSPYIPKNSERMPRALRRTLEREGMTNSEVEQRVTFVDLRAAVREEQGEREETGRSVDWSQGGGEGVAVEEGGMSVPKTVYVLVHDDRFYDMGDMYIRGVFATAEAAKAALPAKEVKTGLIQSDHHDGSCCSVDEREVEESR